MRIQSRRSNTYFEPWQTPIMSLQTVGFDGILNTRWRTHFCLSVDTGRVAHIVTIPSSAPYRVFEEAHLTFLDKYFDTTMSTEELSTLRPRFCQTWKLWNTDYIKEMDKGVCLSGSVGDHNPEIFQCFIKTQEEWIEFIYPTPEWRVIENSNFEEIVNYYLVEDVPKD